MGDLDKHHTEVDPRLGPDQPARVVVWLDDERARDVELTGAKAANLAVARRAGLPVYDGFVLTTEGSARLGTCGLELREPCGPLHDAWSRLSRDGAIPLIVRSSSVLEDSSTSSMAGRFVSVLHVDGWASFAAAVDKVITSAGLAGPADAPIAVLVQPMAQSQVGGVLFGLDPITGDRSSFRVSLVEGLPEQIVSGAVTGTQLTISARGRIRSLSSPLPASLDRRHRVGLARLARRAASVFGAPQDIEWLLDDGRLRLLQSRPITAAASIPAAGSRLLGTGPVAETFPDALHPLELDLWLPPLQDGIREALRIAGASGKRALTRRLVYDVGGTVAVDLEALGVARPRPTLLRQLDPRPPTRRLRAAWRVGRLRTALPAIVDDVIAEVDEHLAAVPELSQLPDAALLTAMLNGQRTLTALHAYEVLAGVLATGHEVSATGAGVALSALAKARADGLTDSQIIARHPAVLVLSPPGIGGERRLPAGGIPQRTSTSGPGDAMGVAREALRMRVRWVQELTARAAEELGGRLARRGQLRRAEDVRDVSFTTLTDTVTNLDVAAVSLPFVQRTDPLPPRFRLARDGTVVADGRASDGGVIGVSPGRVTAEITHDVTAAANKVLVVRTLDPQLASVLPLVAAVVSSTGSPLSHLAILAREYKVPTVVGVTDAWATLRDGDVVVVDGSAGTVEVVTPSGATAGQPGTTSVRGTGA